MPRKSLPLLFLGVWLCGPLQASDWSPRQWFAKHYPGCASWILWRVTPQDAAVKALRRRLQETNAGTEFLSDLDPAEAKMVQNLASLAKDEFHFLRFVHDFGAPRGYLLERLEADYEVIALAFQAGFRIEWLLGARDVVSRGDHWEWMRWAWEQLRADGWLAHPVFSRLTPREIPRVDRFRRLTEPFVVDHENKVIWMRMVVSDEPLPMQAARAVVEAYKGVAEDKDKFKMPYQQLVLAQPFYRSRGYERRLIDY